MAITSRMSPTTQTVLESRNGDEQMVRAKDTPQPVKDLLDAFRSVSERRLVECYHDALQAREQALQMFSVGYLTLEARGLRASIGDRCLIETVEGDGHEAEVVGFANDRVLLMPAGSPEKGSSCILRCVAPFAAVIKGHEPPRSWRFLWSL